MSVLYNPVRSRRRTFVLSIDKENKQFRQKRKMKRLVAFFEIPAADFDRAVKFYENLFGVGLTAMDCGDEKMAFFPDEDGLCPGAISWTSDFGFKPSSQGVLVSFQVEDMESALTIAVNHGGKVLIAKTRIEADNRGWFSVLTDSEGNRIGLYSDN